MLIKKLLKYKYIIILLLIVISGLCLYFLPLPPISAKDDLQVMKLTPDATATFRLESQLSYSPDLESNLENQLKELPADVITTSTLNLSLTLANDAPDLSIFVETLMKLSPAVPQLTLSLLPNSD